MSTTTFIPGATDTSTLNPQLICPVFDIFFPYLPEKIRKPLRFGVRHGEVSHVATNTVLKIALFNVPARNSVLMIRCVRGSVLFLIRFVTKRTQHC